MGGVEQRLLVRVYFCEWACCRGVVDDAGLDHLVGCLGLDHLGALSAIV